MSLPIDSAALEAQAKAEHEYGERLMDLATERAVYAKREAVLAEDVEWAAKRATEGIKERYGLPTLPPFHLGPQRATPASPAQLKAIANQAREAV